MDRNKFGTDNTAVELLYLYQTPLQLLVCHNGVVNTTLPIAFTPVVTNTSTGTAAVAIFSAFLLPLNVSGFVGACWNHCPCVPDVH